MTPVRVELVDGPVEVLDLPAAAAAAEHPPLVLLHEGLGSLALWRQVPHRLRAALGHRVVAWSRHGHGRSGPRRAPSDHRYHDREAGRVLPELLAQLEVHRPVLVGHSDGATIGLLAAARERSEVAAVVAMAPHVFVDARTWRGAHDAREAYADGLRARLAAHHDDVDAMFRAWNDVWTDPTFAASWDVTDELAEVRCPVLLVQGTEDPYGTLEQLDRIATVVRGTVERLELPGVGHQPHLEAAEPTLAAIVAFVHAHVAPPGGSRA